jgi:hypothetical protein
MKRMFGINTNAFLAQTLALDGGMTEILLVNLLTNFLYYKDVITASPHVHLPCTIGTQYDRVNIISYQQLSRRYSNRA